jgi:hypothetical protein
MLTLVMTVLAFFVPFANTASPRLSRRARVPLALGAAILTTTVIFFFLQSRDVQTGQDISTGLLISATFYMGAALLGLPYLIYKVARQRDDLVGPAADWASEQWTQAKRSPLRGVAYSALIFMLPLAVTSCGCCSVALVVWATTP